MHALAVVEVEFLAEFRRGDDFELVLVVVGAFGRDDVGGFVRPVPGLDGGGIAEGGAVGPVLVLPAVDLDRVDRAETRACPGALGDQRDVEGAGEGFVAESGFELLHVAR